MRIPFSKVYRAFPEFDPFPDEECERYVRYAYRQARFRIGCIPAVVVVGAFVLWIPIVILMSTLLKPFIQIGTSGEWIFILLFVSTFLFPALLGLVTRDKVLLRILHDRIRNARCPECQFSLLGLPVKEGIARCPECGCDIVLRLHNLTPEDLLIRRAGEKDAPGEEYTNCSACGFDLRGVSIVQNTIRCPECSHVETLHRRAVMQSLSDGRLPGGFVNASARVTTCPGCAKSLLGTPIFEGQARCMECGFIASVQPRPEDHTPPAESASEVGLRIKQRRATGSPGVSEGERVEDARGGASTGES